MRGKHYIEEQLRQDAKRIRIPEEVKPHQIKKQLEEHQRWNQIDMEDGSEKEARQTNKKDMRAKSRKRRILYTKIAAIAASFCILAVGAVSIGSIRAQEDNADVLDSKQGAMNIASADDRGIWAHITQGTETIQVTYEEVYASMNQSWEKEEYWMYEDSAVERLESETEGVPLAEEPAAPAVSEDVAWEAPASDGEADLESNAYGTTNVQTVGIDEGDIVKNDGRYLYQIVTDYGTWPSEQEIQIVDTEGGLKEVARVDGFEYISEFYVWEDLLLVIENKYMDYDLDDGMEGCYDLAYQDGYYHEIAIYDLTNREEPKEVKTFTLQGACTSSRIADGYFYGFSRFYASPGEGEEDYDAYIPTLDGTRLAEECIVLPKDTEGTSYLVLVSIDLSNPTEFVQTAGIVSDSDMYYVSSNNIYVADMIWTDYEDSEGWSSDKTKLMRFSYEDGRFYLEAEGEVKGTLDDTFSLDEYDKHLRVVTTVREYLHEEIIDDRTGENIGIATVDTRQTNALYVLDEALTLTGQIEGLAEDEQIYSARFMGTIGYFVTFRQTDPLFTVDLSDPTSPKILSELKVSGFSDYLHIYGEDRLFGLGMEADEETGAQEYLKLSMFDVSDPTNVQEISRLPLEHYLYADALYDHHFILINPGANIIGFAASGDDGSGWQEDYVVFSYENDTFVEKLKIHAQDLPSGSMYLARGTFIGDIFYLLSDEGNVSSYNWHTGEFIEHLVS